MVLDAKAELMPKRVAINPTTRRPRDDFFRLGAFGA